jgi:hypothetical protein
MLSTVAQALLIWFLLSPLAAMSIDIFIHAEAGSEPLLEPVKNFKPDGDRATGSSYSITR